MRKTDKNIMATGCESRTGYYARKTTLFVVLFLGTMGLTFAQSHDHEDTVVALEKGAFTISVLQNSPTQFNLQLVSNKADTLQPFFIEMIPIGFDFTDECILSQSLNNQRLETNIEKLWGPQFVSLGVGIIPPGGRYLATLATQMVTKEAMIKVRVFGTINGQNFIWVGYVKK